MQNRSLKKVPYIYRPYYFPSDFPVWAFLGDYWKVHPGTPQSLHFHNALELGHCIRGEGTLYHISLGEHSFETDDFSIFYPQSLHASSARKEPSSWEYIFIDLQKFANTNPAFFKELLQIFYIPQQISPIITARSMPLLHSHFDHIFQEMHEKKTFYQNAVSGLFISVVSELHLYALQTESLAAEENAYSYSYICNALNYIYEHYNERISIRQLAEYCHLSESHFRRLFLSIVGISPLDFIQHYRIQQACDLLQQNQDPISSIAAKVGYTTLSSFNRQFQQYLNLSPQKWQKQHLVSQRNHDVLSFHHSDTKHIFDI
ncbi:MAG: helix-turn-helix domain-containing protein [Fusicatenibacter sp.]